MPTPEGQETTVPQPLPAVEHPALADGDSEAPTLPVPEPIAAPQETEPAPAIPIFMEPEVTAAIPVFMDPEPTATEPVAPVSFVPEPEQTAAQETPVRPLLSFDLEPEPEPASREFLSGRPIPAPPATKPKSTRGRKSTKASEVGPDKVLVPEDEVLFQKQYYTIGEVATMFGVNISQIRYWENEFPQLKPRKNAKGDRLFRPEDVKTLVLIFDLIRRRKYTLEGAKEYLKRNNGADERFALIQQLQKMRLFLNELKANM